MPGENIIMLQTVANGLGELKDEMVFVVVRLLNFMPIILLLRKSGQRLMWIV